MNKLTKYALIDSLGVIVYVFLIALFFSSAQSIFGDGPKVVLIPLMMLLLLVLSAAITGSLVFGRSVLMYLDGDKKDSIKLVIYKMIVLFVMIFIVATALYLSR